MSLFETKEELDKHVRTTFSKLSTENEKNLRGFTFSTLYYSLGEFSSALQYVSSYLRVKNDSAPAYKLQGECYEKLNKIEEALESYKQSLCLEPKQFDLLKHICKLVAANEHILSTSDSQFWCDYATTQNCQDESVLNLRLKVMNLANDDPKQVQNTILSEIVARPTDVSLRIRLVNHYLSQNCVSDAFTYTYDIEMQQNEFFAQSIDWYNAISSVLAKCNTEQKTKWPFWLLSIMTLERQCFLKLCAAEMINQQQTLNLTECANLLFEFDQTLSAASSIVFTLCSERELIAQFLHHYRGQLCLHAATFLFKRDRFQQTQNRESTINALILLLVAYNCGIPSNDEAWLRNSSESTKQLIRLWSQEGAFRCSQAGRTLLSCIDDEKQIHCVMVTIRIIYNDWTTSEELVNQLRRASSNSDWRKNLFQMLFSNPDHAGKSTTSHLLKCSEMDDLNYELPKVSDLDTYEECAQWLRPSSLAQMVYLYIGATNLSDVTCHTFNGLNLSIENLIYCGAETLNQLDVDTFLYATTIQAKRKLEIERCATETLNKGTNFVKPKILPFANISSMLVTEEQANWWLCAYKVCNNISDYDLADMRQQLQYGIEVVRGMGGPIIDAIICLKLGQIFLKRSQSSSKVVEQGFLDTRTLALFKFSLHMIKMQNLGINRASKKRKKMQNTRTIDSRLFKYANGQDYEVKKQVDNLAEEAISHLVLDYFKTNDYEQCIDILSNIALPSATYFIATAYRRLEESNQTPKKNQRIYVDKASDYLQQTLTLLDHPNVDPKHLLRGIVDSDIRELRQRHSFNNSTNGGHTSLNDNIICKSLPSLTPVSKLNTKKVVIKPFSQDDILYNNWLIQKRALPSPTPFSKWNPKKLVINPYSRDDVLYDNWLIHNRAKGDSFRMKSLDIQKLTTLLLSWTVSVQSKGNSNQAVCQTPIRAAQIQIPAKIQIPAIVGKYVGANTAFEERIFGAGSKLFGERSRLYRYDATNEELQEQGVGELKILYHPVNDTYRFLLCREQIFRCMLSHQLSANLSVNRMKSSEKAFTWEAHNYYKGSNGDSRRIAVEFENSEVATRFIDIVGRCINKLKAKGGFIEPKDD